MRYVYKPEVIACIGDTLHSYVCIPVTIHIIMSYFLIEFTYICIMYYMVLRIALYVRNKFCYFMRMPAQKTKIEMLGELKRYVYIHTYVRT